MARDRFNLLDRSHLGFAPGSRLARDGRLMPPVRRRLPLPTPMDVSGLARRPMFPASELEVPMEGALPTVDPRVVDRSALLPISSRLGLGPIESEAALTPLAIDTVEKIARRREAPIERRFPVGRIKRMNKKRVSV